MVNGLYFFGDDVGATQSVNGECHRAIINDFVMSIVRENNLNGFWF